MSGIGRSSIFSLLLVQLLLSRQQATTGGIDHDKLQGEALEACLTLLEDPEPRVRLSVSECMRLLAEQQGIAVWLRSRDAILQSISACWVHSCAFMPRVMPITASRNAMHSRVAAQTCLLSR